MLVAVVVVAVVIAVFLSGGAVAGTYTSDALADKIANLPGTENLGTLKFNQFSGYLAIPGTSGTNSKKMHYWMVESMSDPSTDPLAFWTNGGKPLIDASIFTTPPTVVVNATQNTSLNILYNK